MNRALGVHRRHPIVLALGYALIAAHLVLAIKNPPSVEASLYLVWSVSYALCAFVVARHAIKAHGLGAFRWSLFVFYFVVMVVRYGVAAFNSYTLQRHHISSDLLSGIAFTTALIALTLPSAREPRGERIVDGVVASSLCALRILVLQHTTPVFKTQWSLLTFYLLSAALAWIVAQLAYSAAAGEDKPFYRLAIWFWGITTLTTFLSDHIGVLVFRAGILWSLSATIGLVLFLKLALDNLDFPYRVPRRASRNVLVQSLLPFTMSACVIALGSLLMRGHAVFGSCAIAIGVAAFFARTVLLSHRLRQNAEKLAQQNAELTALAHRDDLTGLSNRRSFEHALRNALQLATDPSRPAVLALFDVDGFKGANDTHGHPHGDACLVAIADVLQSHLPTRRSGIFRLGGDEFAAVWTATDIAAATQLAHHLCRRVSRLKLRAAGRTLTLSVGLTSIVNEFDHPTLLHQADVALYRSKQRGGNCVEAFDPAAAEPIAPRGHRLRDLRAPAEE